MEIKARETVKLSDTWPLRDVAHGLGEVWRGGIVIYRGHESPESTPLQFPRPAGKNHPCKLKVRVLYCKL